MRRAFAVVMVLVASACTPLGTSETVELSDAPAAGSDADAAAGPEAEVLGRSITRETTTTVMDLAPTTTEPLLPPATTPPPTTAAPTTAAPAPTVTTAPPAAPVLTLPPLGPNAARALEGLTSDTTRDVAARALSLISFDWRNGLPGWELRFLDGRSGYRGLTYTKERIIEVFVRSGDTAESLAHVVAHEMGHAVDISRLDDGDRNAWAAARGYLSAAPWWVPSGGSDFASGAGDFAESFAWWQARSGQWFGELGPPPSAVQLGLLETLTYTR